MLTQFDEVWYHKSPMLGNDRNEDLHARVVREVLQCWEGRKLPALLSWLGNQNDAELSRLAKQNGTTIKQYLSTRVADRIQVIQHERKDELIGALPIAVDVTAEGGKESLLERTQHSDRRETRFHPALWAAFRKPIEQSMRRFVTDRIPIGFRDLSPGEEPFGVEVEPEYIVGLEADRSEVQEKIQRWFKEKGVGSEIYLSANLGRPEEPQTLLDLVLDSLEPSDLQRVTMPLDVIRKLRRRLL